MFTSGGLLRSAQLTSVSAIRGHRLLMAAEQAFGLGRSDLVDQLVREAASTDLSELDRARTQWLREIFHDGVPGDATRVLELCAVARSSARAGDRDLALNLLLGAALRCWWADTGLTARARVGAFAVQLAAILGAPPSEEKAKEFGVHAMFFVVTPDPGELARLAELVDDSRLRTVVSQTFPLRDGRRAFESGGRPRPPGKTVLIVR